MVLSYAAWERRSGTGSRPPRPNGLQRSTRRNARSDSHDRAASPDGLLGVVGARRREATLSAEPPGQREPVEPDHARPEGAARGRRRSTGGVGRTSCARPSALKQFGHLGDQILGSGVPDGLAGHQDDVMSCHPTRRDLADRRPKDTPGSVPLHRAADLLPGDQRELPRAGSDKQYHPLPVHRFRVTEDALDRRSAHRPGQPETLRRLRPLRRRAARIARPARVRIRRRKPWVFARRRVFGWYVRFPLAILGSFAKGRPATPPAEGGSIRKHPWMEGLTTERASRGRHALAVWKNPVL